MHRYIHQWTRSSDGQNPPSAGGESGSNQVAARDPETGQFVQGSAGVDWRDVEPLHFADSYGIPAADLGGGTGFGGGERSESTGNSVIDLTEIIDRDEVAELLLAEIMVAGYIQSTATADGSMRSHVEVSTSPAFRVPQPTTNNVDAEPGPQGTDVIDRFELGVDVTDDVICRPLTVAAGNSFSDGATGVGGASGAVVDRAIRSWTAGGAPVYDDRDEIFVNLAMENWNMDDNAIYTDVYANLWFLPRETSRR